MITVIRVGLIFIIGILSIQLAKSREIREIIVHTTDANVNCGAECVNKMHVAKGWDSCGYHKIVMVDGSVEDCRPFEVIGAHVRGFNTTSVGVAWAGQGLPSKLQYESLRKLVKSLMKRFNLSSKQVHGHKEYSTSGTKTCPNINMNIFRRLLND